MIEIIKGDTMKNLDIKGVKEQYKIYIKEALEDIKTKGRRYRQIPNIITSSRLIAAPFFIIPAALCKNLLLLVIFVTFFSLTDAFDGFIARKYKLVSELGKDLDAICDKVFALSLLIAASIFEPILVINIVAEVIIAIINIRQKLHGYTPKSLMIGKIKTWVLYPLLGLAFLGTIVNSKEIFLIFLAASFTMQVFTIASYLIKYEGKKEDKSELSELMTKEATHIIK